MEDCPGKWSHPVIKIFESLKRVEQPKEEPKPKKEEIKPKKDANVPKDKHK
ncbi:hypothetical protein KKF45_04510 [Patescibacteria group bacterium]|nr:hypothetical protein [Patescibacteria group bacterium]